MTITDKLLFAIGGWREMKPARALAASGAVDALEVTPERVTASVSCGGQTYRAGLKWTGPQEAENLCTCRASRRDGIICSHSLAVGVAAMQAAATPAAGQPGSATAPAAKPVSALAAARGAPASARGAGWPRIADGPVTGAEPLELRLVLPPNLPRACRDNRVQIGCEIRRAGEGETDWKLASTLTSCTAEFWVAPESAALLDVLRRLSPDEPPGVLLLGRRELGELLTAAWGAVSVLLGRRERLTLDSRPRALPARIEPHPQAGVVATPRVGGLDLLDLGVGLFALSAGVLSPLDGTLPPACREAIADGRSLPLCNADAYALADRLERIFQFDNPERLPRFESAEFAAQFRLAGSLRTLRCSLSLGHPAFEQPLRIAAGRQPAHIVWPLADRPPDAPVCAVIDSRAIAALQSRLDHWGFEADSDGSWLLRGEDAVISFIARHLAEMRRLGAVDFQHTLQQQIENVDVVEPETAIHAASGGNWFALNVSFAAGKSPVSQREISQLLASGKSHRKRPDGRILAADTQLLDDFQSALADINASQSSPGCFSIQPPHAEYLGHILGRKLEPALPSPGTTTADTPPRTSLQQAISRLDTTLRNYQISGVHWLHDRLHRHHGALLADDMGLGKTLQALAIIEATSPAALVVCPATLTAQWLRAAESFLPHRKSQVLSSDSISIVTDKECDTQIFIVSYGLVREYDLILQKCRFDCLVLDEIQVLRNPASQTRRSVSRLAAGWRLGLSGTPLENRVGDAWSVIDLLVPGYLGARREFEQRFGASGAAPQPGAGGQRRLRARLAPLVLRRLKSEVVGELPPKTVQCVPCELSPTQRAIYADLARAGAQLVTDGKGGVNRVAALTALLRLRQAALDARLLGLDRTLDDAAASGKHAVFDGILNDIRDNGRKVLVFSQFRSMLQIVAGRLAAAGVGFAYLDGQTGDRAREVERFSRDPQLTVFLISLKAGGTGLNLAAADCVIHLEPWWNPMVEEQANDRAHRIGQSSPVHVYKLISTGTVEEGIVELQQRKRQLFNSLFNQKPESPQNSTSLDTPELVSLLHQ